MPASSTSPSSEQVTRIVKSVEQLNAAFKQNHDYSFQRRDKLGRGYISTVTFKGAQGETYYNYVTELKGELRAYMHLSDMLTDGNNRILTIWLPEDIVQYCFVAMAFILLGVTCYIGITNPENKALQLFTGLLGGLAGFLVGKGVGPSG